MKFLHQFLTRHGRRQSRAQENAYQFSLQRSCPELAPELTAPVTWSRVTPGPLAEGIATMFNATPGAHKWHHYFQIYDELFGPLRTRPIRLLEIGVYKGASTHVWRNYFHPGSTLVGIDINPECAEFADPGQGVHIRIGPQQDKQFISGIIGEFGPFDLIIDDGSHITSHMISTFNHLFPDGLKNGGLYFVEDTHSNFWVEFRDAKRSFLDFAYGLVECMHAHYTVCTGEHFYRVNGPDSVGSVRVPRITTLIKEIRFLDSVVAIRKADTMPLPQSQHW